MRNTSWAVAAVALAIGCRTPEEPREPPRALAAALGAGPAPTQPTPGEDDRRQVERFDLGPFLEVGHADAAPRVRAALASLLEAHALGAAERAPEVRLEGSGHVLRVRAERSSQAVARSWIAGLRDATTLPVALDVHLAEVPGERLALLAGPPTEATTEALLAALTEDLGRGVAETLVRRRLRLRPGLRASVRETYARRPVVRIALEGGLPVGQQETVEDGLALHATVWLGATGDALAHLELAFQHEADDEPRSLAVSYRRPQADAVTEAELDLPRVRLAGLRGQLRLPRGVWQVAAVGPAERSGRGLVALVRASWTPPPAPAGPIQTLQVALPHRTQELAEEAAAKKSAFFGSSMLGGRTEHLIDGLAAEYTRQQAVAVHNDLSFGLGRLRPAEVAGDAGWSPLLPEALVAHRRRVEALAWGPGQGLVYLWDRLHVLHEPRVGRELSALLEAVERWRNRPLHVRAEWLEVDPQELEGLEGPEELRAALPELREGRALEAYRLTARSGAWTELSASHNAAVLWGSFGPDRPSPETRVVTRGSRLGVRPRRYGDGRVELALRFAHQQARGASLEAVPQGAGWVHKPRFHESTLEHTLTVVPGEPQLLLGESTPDGARVRALVVTCWEG